MTEQNQTIRQVLDPEANKIINTTVLGVFSDRSPLTGERQNYMNVERFQELETGLLWWFTLGQKYPDKTIAEALQEERRGPPDRGEDSQEAS